MTKQEIRRKMKELKHQLEESLIMTYSDAITRQLMQTSAYTQCNHLFCYVSFNQEVLTNGIILTALSQNKKVAVPKIIGEEMKFFYIESLDQLKPGVLGILEPDNCEEAIPDKSNKNLVIVPGLAFDYNKNRIGYGKGYYDRFFLKYENIPMKKIALSYDFQVIEELPLGKYDKSVDQIITQNGIIL